MKKAMLLTGALLTLMTTVTMGTVESDRFVNSIEKQIYRNANTGELTQNEVRVLNNLLYEYQNKVYQYGAYNRLTKQEQKRLYLMEERIVERLEQLTYNRVTVQSQRYSSPNVAVYYGNRSPYYTTRRATTTRRTTARRGTYCPPTRGRY